MAIHIGKKIREEVDKQQMSITVFAKKINRSRNVAYDIFKREDVDTSLLKKISKILNCNFFSLLSSQKEYTQEGVKNFYVNEPQAQYSKMSDVIVQLQNENQELKKEVDLLKQLIVESMQTKKGSKKSPKK